MERVCVRAVRARKSQEMDQALQCRLCTLQGPVGTGTQERRSVAGNALTKTTLTGASALAKKVRVIMSEPGTPEAAYGISGIKVHFFPTIFDDLWWDFCQMETKHERARM